MRGACEIFTNPEDLKYVFTRKEQNIQQRRWWEVVKDYDLKTQHHEEKPML